MMNPSRTNESNQRFLSVPLNSKNVRFDKTPMTGYSSPAQKLSTRKNTIRLHPFGGQSILGASSPVKITAKIIDPTKSCCCHHPPIFGKAMDRITVYESNNEIDLDVASDSSDSKSTRNKVLEDEPYVGTKRESSVFALGNSLHSGYLPSGDEDDTVEEECFSDSSSDEDDESVVFRDPSTVDLSLFGLMKHELSTTMKSTHFPSGNTRISITHAPSGVSSMHAEFWPSDAEANSSMFNSDAWTKEEDASFMISNLRKEHYDWDWNHDDDEQDGSSDSSVSFLCEVEMDYNESISSISSGAGSPSDGDDGYWSSNC
jgi:hypothetical protein